MAFPSKCAFLKKPLETLVLGQTQRSLFVDYTMKCTVKSRVLLRKNEESKAVSNTLMKSVQKAIHTAAAASSTKKTENLSTSHSAPLTAVHQNSTVRQSDAAPLAGFDFDPFFTEMIQRMKDDNSYRVFRRVNRSVQQFPMAKDYSFSNDPQDITVWCSNDYLGMSRHKSVVEASMSIIENNGVGAGGSRSISGTSQYHGLLEKALADWHQKEAGLLYTSGFVANDTALHTLGQKLPGCEIYSDAGNHSSMIHGIRTSGAKKFIFRHNDPGHLEQLLMQSDPNVPKIVAFETVHSMSGDICPLEDICDVAHKYGALTFVDEVHAAGLYGKHGAGIGERDNVLHKMDIISGTLGKAIGSFGGYLVGKEGVMDTLRSYSSGFIFTAALPPDKVYAAMVSLAILQSEEGQILRQRLEESVKKLRTKLVKHGLPIEYSPSHIVPVLIGDADKGNKVSQQLQQKHGIYIQSISYPTVQPGEEKLRIAPSPFHTDEMMDRLVYALDDAWKTWELPFTRAVCQNNCECQFECKNHAQ